MWLDLTSPDFFLRLYLLDLINTDLDLISPESYFFLQVWVWNIDNLSNLLSQQQITYSTTFYKGNLKQGRKTTTALNIVLNSRSLMEGLILGEPL